MIGSRRSHYQWLPRLDLVAFLYSRTNSRIILSTYVINVFTSVHMFFCKTNASCLLTPDSLELGNARSSVNFLHPPTHLYTEAYCIKFEQASFLILPMRLFHLSAPYGFSSWTFSTHHFQPIHQPTVYEPMQPHTTLTDLYVDMVGYKSACNWRSTSA